MDHSGSEQESWAEINQCLLVLESEHYSFWLLKSFLYGWEIDPLMREHTNDLCDKVLQHGPPIESLPNDADYSRLAMYATAVIVFHFTCVVDKARPRLNEKNRIMNDGDLASLLAYCRILLRYYSLHQNTAALQDVKEIATNLFAMNLRSNPDDEGLCSLLRDIWVKFSNSEFGDFNKIKAKRPSQNTVKTAIERLANDRISNAVSQRSSPVLYEIFSQSHKEMQQQQENVETNKTTSQTTQASKNDDLTVHDAAAEGFVPHINTSLELPLSAIDIGNLQKLDNETLTKLHDAFVRMGMQKPPVLFDSIRSFFETNARQQLIVPVPQLDVESHATQVAEPEISGRSQRNGIKRAAEPDAQICALNVPSTDNVVDPVDALNTSMSPSFSECMVYSPQKLSKNCGKARATLTTPTTEANPTLRALVRGVTARKNAENPVALSVAEHVKLVPPQKLHKAQDQTNSETVPSNIAPAVDTVVNAPSVLTTTSGQQNDNVKATASSATPSIAAKPRLKERIGAPEESSSSDSDSDSDSFNFSISESDSEDRVVENRKRKRQLWTPEEYKAVMAGVKRFGEGKWREIQLHYPVLKRRSNVAVKDAYRLILRNPALVSNK